MPLRRESPFSFALLGALKISVQPIKKFLRPKSNLYLAFSPYVGFSVHGLLAKRASGDTKKERHINIIIVLLSSDRHKKDTEQHRTSIHVALPYPTDSSLVISKYAVKAVSSIFKNGIKYKRAGVIVTGLIPNDNFQLNLFERQNPKHRPLMNTIDNLNLKLGDYKIKLANQDLRRTWKMHQKHLSSRYTTNIDELLVINS